MTLSENQLLDWIRLIRTEGVGPRTFFSLLNHYGGAAEALKALPELSRKRGLKSVALTTQAAAEDELRAVQRFGARFIARGESVYPKALAVIDSAPPLLTVIGPLNLAAQPLISIVGSRNASTAGLKMAERLSARLGGAGFGIVSGLARGIDAKAHHASLPTSAIAVVAGGLDRLYPEENRALFEQLCHKGAVVSEMPFGWQPRGRDFPRRNRIVSGLSLGTVIIEAALKSGSLITARFANEQGREVFAVPGSPFDLRSEGPNSLIRQGATLVRNEVDILEVLNPLIDKEFTDHSISDGGGDNREESLWDETDWLETGLRPDTGPSEPPFEGWEEGPPQSNRDRVLALLTMAPTDPDELARAAGISIREMQIILYDLESDNLAERGQGGRVFAKV
ncbi:MAG: DNA-processing protein DprA [Beijerinckiaceae bacterium]